MRNPLPLVTSILAPVCGAALCAQDRASRPVELGAVDFARDLDQVLGRRPQQPLFLLFQEIPG